MHKRITITIDEETLRLAEERVKAGDARSLSAFIAKATEQQVKKEKLSDVMEDIIAETGGIDPEIDEWAHKVLGLSSSTPAH